MSADRPNFINNVEIGPQGFETNREQCEFCSIPERGGSQPFFEMHGRSDILNIPNLPLSYTLTQDIVPIADEGGHLLLMPNKVGRGHYVSLAIVNDQYELANARDAVVGALRQNYSTKPIFIFEHGPGFINGEEIACGGCHMDHAHGHFLLLPEGTMLKPIQDKMEEKLTQMGWQNPAGDSIRTDQIFTRIYDIAGINPYLHVGMISSNGTQESFTYVQTQRSQNVPSQLLRSVVAETVYDETDSTYWNWRDVTHRFTSTERYEQLKQDVIQFRERTQF